MAAAHALLERVRSELKGQCGRPVKNPYMDLVIGGPPPYETLGSEPAWMQARTFAYFRDALSFMVEAVPDAMVVSANIHQDERAPHMRLLFLPYNCRPSTPAARALDLLGLLAGFTRDWRMLCQNWPNSIQEGDDGS